MAHAFELVELNPQELPDEDGECYIHRARIVIVLAKLLTVFVAFFFLDDFPESTGVKRIVQALNANVWSSVEMKDGEMTGIQLNYYIFS